MPKIDDYIDEKGLFDGRYRLLRLMDNEGGTSDVWVAEDTQTAETELNEGNYELEEIQGTGVLVAIKIYRPKNILDMEGESTFKNEFKTVFNCHHANLITPKGFATLREMPYLVMPYCRNGSAKRLIGILRDSDQLWRFLFDVASGLDYLHSLNPIIIHQDIKPANILIDDNGYYCITDFGISVQRERDNFRSEHDGSGTTQYMPPERFNRLYDPVPKSDIWALGATLYELITGNTPFGEEGGMQQTDETEIPKIKEEVPREFKQVVYDCLNYNPEKRPNAKKLIDIARRKGKIFTKDKTFPLFVFFAIVMSGILSMLFFRSEPANIDFIGDREMSLKKEYRNLIGNMVRGNTDDIILTYDSLRLLAEDQHYKPAIHEYLKLQCDWCDMREDDDYKKLQPLSYIKMWQKLKERINVGTIDNQAFADFVYQNRDSDFIYPEDLILLALNIDRHFNWVSEDKSDEQEELSERQLDSIKNCVDACNRDKLQLSFDWQLCRQSINSLIEKYELY